MSRLYTVAFEYNDMKYTVIVEENLYNDMKYTVIVEENLYNGGDYEIFAKIRSPDGTQHENSRWFCGERRNWSIERIFKYMLRVARLEYAFASNIVYTRLELSYTKAPGVYREI